MCISLAELQLNSIDCFRDVFPTELYILPRPEPLNLILYLPASLNRLHVESFIYNQFKLKHGAEIRYFMPYLLSLENSNKEVISAAGFRPACNENLFLEQYLDESVETLLSGFFRRSIQRESIIEVGNLASDCPGSSRLMIMSMTSLFEQQGFEWVVMTGTNELLNIFRNLKLQPIPITQAEASRLCDKQSNWGSYYTHDPRVMAGNIRKGHRELIKSKHYRKFINSLRALNLSECT